MNDTNPNILIIHAGRICSKRACEDILGYHVPGN